MLTFYIDEQSAWAMHSLYVGDDISESVPSPRFNEQSGDGIDGTYRTFLETYDDVKQTFTCYFYVNAGMSWKSKLRHIKSWLFSFNDNNVHRLQFADDFEWYKRVSKIEIGDAEYIGSRTGKFKLEITCEPYDYMVEGIYEHEINQCTYNSWNMCKPIYVLYGVKGETHWFSVNGNRTSISFESDSDNTVYFDVDKGIAYNSSKKLIKSTNHILNKMRLENGLNEIKTSEGLNMKIIPNWRCV